MASVRIQNIPFNERYVHMVLDPYILTESATYNLRLLYEFIDNNSPGKSTGKNGKAYRIILKRARELAGSRRRIISKRQVAALIKVIKKETGQSIKIPYASEYIFRAVFDTFEKYKDDKSIIVPPEIIMLYGKVRREVFYNKQSEQYKYKYENGLLNDREELKEIRKALLNDICSEECSLGKEF